MRYLENYKTANLDMLRESGIYSEQILQAIKDGNHKALGKPEIISKEQSQDIHFMGPIVYAFEKEHRTYIGYKYCGENLQKNLDFATDILREAPEIIKDTLVSNDRKFIETVAQEIPEVVKHMSAELKTDTTFTAELCELNVPEITKYAAQECKMPDTIIQNQSLAENKAFMVEAIKEDAKVLEYTSDELKNDYQFMKEVSENKDAINYVVDHIGDFGEQGLSGTKDALIEISSDEAIIGFEEEQKSVKKQIEEKTDDSTKLEELLKRDKQLQRHIKFFERIKNGEVDPVRAAKLIDKICLNLDERYREEIKQVLKLDEAILEKQKEKEEQEKAKTTGKISTESIEKTTQDASYDGITEETKAIRQVIENERTGGEPIGEKVNDKSDE